MAGKIVAVIGCTRKGKSYLVKKLAEHYHAPYLLEWEEPTADADIVTYIKKNTHPIERYQYFRDLFVAHHLCAEKMTGRSLKYRYRSIGCVFFFIYVTI